MTASNPFHLAIPVSDLDVTLAFYEGTSGAPAGARVTIGWISTSLVINWCFTEPMREKGQVPRVPIPWMGSRCRCLTLAWCSNGRLLSPDRALGESKLRVCDRADDTIQGEAGEQKTCFLMDPSENYLEFKSFRDPDALFSTDTQTYV